MNIKELESILANLMGLVFNLDSSEINEESSVDNIEAWDSITHLNLIISLEEEFDISIPDDDVGTMMNYKIILYVIKELKNIV